MNEKYFLTIDKDKDISEFEKILKDVKEKKQKVDVIKEKPDYDILIRYKNEKTHGLHLVLGNTGEESKIMYIGNENNGFYISSEDTEILRNIFDIQ